MKSVLERFSRKVKFQPNGCWEWQGGRYRQGYGKFRAFNGTLAHRASYSMFVEPVAKELCVLHRCDNPPCVNPAHLFLGDRKLNAQDRNAKGRSLNKNSYKTHCHRGHELEGENLYVLPNGRRQCKICRLARQRARRAKREAAL